MTRTAGINFILDGERISLTGIEPCRTVLQLLREDLGRCGTKEGCAEGDCGACTVVLGEVDEDGRMQFRAVNACIQFAPVLDGKRLFTVESLGSAVDELHPVQQAMYECHGSQCGFCTPGFVMSLFALYKTQPEVDRRVVDETLAGNLCRCTGYRPIVDAAARMYQIGANMPDEASWLRQPGKGSLTPDEQEACKQLSDLSRHGTLWMSSSNTDYYAPTGIVELAGLVLKHPDATVLAGGTDVGLWVTKQYRDLKKIVYVGDVAELQTLHMTSTHLEIGAAVSLTDAMPTLLQQFPEYRELFTRFASPPIRNAGTLGGNVMNGSPIGDSMPALISLDTTIVLRRGEDEREVLLSDYYIDYQKTLRQPGEFLRCIRIPLPLAGQLVRSYKVSKRFDQDISAVCAAFRLDLDGERIIAARIAFGGMAATPKRAQTCEQVLTGRSWKHATVRAGMEALRTDYQPIDDMRASAAYRSEVSVNLLYRFFMETAQSDAHAVGAYYHGR